ncbi:MAG: hypothetical protein ACRCXA_07520 [Peptostreptococcaceae bacterium]
MEKEKERFIFLYMLKNFHEKRISIYELLKEQEKFLQNNDSSSVRGQNIKRK